MKRIDTSTKSVDLFGAGKHGYKDGDKALNIAPTQLNASSLNSIQEEIAEVIEAAGVALNGADYSQLLKVLKSSFSPVVGTMRGGKMSVATASAIATFTADELVLESALAGQPFKIASFNKTINLATTGAGGMDTGAAPASGYVAVYAIYNPTSGVSALLAVNATSGAAPEIYGGANMPAGYTASALISVWRTTAGGLFIAGYQRDRQVFFAAAQVLSNGTATSLTSISLVAGVPANGKTWGGQLSVTPISTGGSASVLTVSPDANSVGAVSLQIPYNSNPVGTIVPISNFPIATAQTAYYLTANPNGNAMYVTNYTF